MIVFKDAEILQQCRLLFYLRLNQELSLRETQMKWLDVDITVMLVVIYNAYSGARRHDQIEDNFE
jgi:hypothetical protein